MQINFFKYFMWKGDFISKQLKTLEECTNTDDEIVCDIRPTQTMLSQTEKGETWNMKLCVVYYTN